MARFRKLKQHLETLLLPPAWPEDAVRVPEDAASVGGMEAVGPLLALLSRVTDQESCEVLDGLRLCAGPAAMFARQALSGLDGCGT